LGATALAIAGVAYPSDILAEFWELVLINQFHDILPGTSIPEVYVDSDADYERIFSTLNSANGPWHASAMAAARPGHQLRLLNFTSQGRKGLISLGAAVPAEGFALATAAGTAPLQQITRADGSTVSVGWAGDIAPLGWTAAQIVAGQSSAPAELSVSPQHLENAHLRIELDPSGEIVSIHDKQRDREVLAPGLTANRLIAYEDKPMEWDAWDIDRYFEEQFWPLGEGKASICVVESGPLRAAIRIERAYRTSRTVQIVSLAVGERQVEFDTFIDWRERAQVIKAVFPFDLNTSEIRSEIQFGHVKRPTHRNTSWDKARFEASMHRWVDLSEPDFGVALLNDSKYAYDCHEQTVRLTLVRGSSFPSPDADIGEHRIRYGLFVHDGVVDLSSVHDAAERFNNPVAVIGNSHPVDAADADLGAFSLARVTAPNVTIETVKKAEASNALVLRVVETANQRARTRIEFGIPVGRVRPVDLMEENPGASLVVENGGVTLSLRPFEIVTLLVEPRES
jgi:alpha-mannosidase